MLLQPGEAAARKPIFVAGHLPAREDGPQASVVRAEHGGTMVLVGIVRRIPEQAFRRPSGQGFPELLKVLAHGVRRGVLVGQGKEERFLEFGVGGEKLLRLMQRATVVPLQSRTYGDVGVEQVGTGDEGVDGEQTTKGMARKDTGRRYSESVLDCWTEVG